ncbi:MAG TPA: iron-sulfur cluster assembly scaffold protein, partial [Turneriella sp.]|nr:iron-sulfur cluster assembly scaffold protein [Turneriella sp.]
MPTYSDEILRLAELEPVVIPAGAQSSELVNRLCGDRVIVSPGIDHERITQLRWQVEGCAILRASAAYLARSLPGKTLGETKALIAAFRNSFTGDKGIFAASPLAPVYALPARFK